MRRPRNTEMTLIETRKEVQEVAEVAVAEEAAIKVEEVALDPKPTMLTVKIVPMANVNHSTKRSQLKVKKWRKLRELKRKSKAAIEETKIEPMKLMKTLTITDITMGQDQNTKEFKSQLTQKFHQYQLRKRERSNQIRMISKRK